MDTVCSYLLRIFLKSDLLRCNIHLIKFYTVYIAWFWQLGNYHHNQDELWSSLMSIFLDRYLCMYMFPSGIELLPSFLKSISLAAGLCEASGRIKVRGLSIYYVNFHLFLFPTPVYNMFLAPSFMTGVSHPKDCVLNFPYYKTSLLLEWWRGCRDGSRCLEWIFILLVLKSTFILI